MSEGRRIRRDRRLFKKLAAVADTINVIRKLIDDDADGDTLQNGAAEGIRQILTFSQTVRKIELSDFYPPLGATCAKKPSPARRSPKRRKAG